MRRERKRFKKREKSIEAIWERLHKLCSLASVREGSFGQSTRIMCRLCDMSATQRVC